MKQVEGLVERANELDEDPGTWDEAESLYREALRREPGHGRALVNLGRLLWARGRREEAVAAFRAAVRACPEHVEAQYNLGYSLLYLGYALPAAGALRAALRLAPNAMDALYVLAEAYEVVGCTGLMRRCLEDCAKLGGPEVAEYARKRLEGSRREPIA